MGEGKRYLILLTLSFIPPMTVPQLNIFVYHLGTILLDCFIPSRLSEWELPSMVQ